MLAILRRFAPSALAMFCCALFLLQGYAFIRRVGLQEDESLFAAAIFKPLEVASALDVSGRSIPLMLDSYLGCLKSWIYTLVFSFWWPTLHSVRLPVLVIGALTIWLFYRFLREAAGTRAALLGCLLLATDTMFVLTTCLDWGPVALQHLLLTVTLLLFLRFHRTGRCWVLALGSLAIGLGLWDKATFVWVLAGLAVATVLVFGVEAVKAISVRNILVIVVLLGAGALPLINHTLHSEGAIVSKRSGLSGERSSYKATLLLDTLDGSALFGYLTRNGDQPGADLPRTRIERLSLALSEASGKPGMNLQPVAVIASIVLLPFLWRTPARRGMMFAAAAFLAGWASMLVTAGGGVGSHHVVLLWPLPQMLVALAFAQLSLARPRAGAVALVLVLLLVCGSGMAVTNEHLASIIERGNTIYWTDATYPLWEFLNEQAIRGIYALDWGIVGPVRLLGAGRLPLSMAASDLWTGQWGEEETALARFLLESPYNYFVTHVEGSELVPGVRRRLREFAEAEGFHEETLTVIPDRHGRPVFEVFHFLRLGEASPKVEASDRIGDGTPDFLRLTDEADRRAFLRWFTFLAEAQYFIPPAERPVEIDDCAALLRFAFREALRRHDGPWASELKLPAVPAMPAVRKYEYPYTPLGANLFRIKPPPLRPVDFRNGAFAQFADARTLLDFNVHFLSRDLRAAEPGDLLFFRQLEQDLPFHVMIFLGASQFAPGDESLLVYHTGPEGREPGEIRRPSVSELMRHPSPRWRPVIGNANFLGVYRWNILRETE